MFFLRQSTASQSVVIGPFVDSTDGDTAETGLTIANTDVRLSKNGANIVAKNSGGGTHDELGYYTITLDATDTDTVGRLQLMVHESGALPVYHEYQVLEEALFDGLFAASAARIPADVTAISGDTTSADNLESYTDGTTPMPVNATQLSGDATAADNAELFFDGTGYNASNSAIGTAAAVTTVNGLAAGVVTAASIASNAITATKIATDAITAAKIAADAIGSSELASTAVTEIRDAITGGAYALDTDANGRVRVVDGTGAGEINTNSGAIALVDAVTTVNGLAADTVNASALAADAVAEINATVDTALSDIHLDHLLAADYDPASKPGTATALLNELVESDGGVSRFTANALEEGPGGGSSSPELLQNTTIATLSTQTSFTLTAGSGDDDAYNGAIIVVTDQSTSTQKAVGLISDYTGSTRTVTLAEDPGIFTMATGDTVDVIVAPKQLPDAAHGASGGLPTVDSNNRIVGIQGTKNTLDDLNDVTTAQVNAEVDTALTDIHLDHLLAADYDPSSKPGTATALLNELVENDGGVSRFTSNALEQAPDTDHTGTGSGLSAIPWNAAWDAEVQSEANDAMVALGLDHLVNAAVVGADVTDNSIVARLVSSSATADWDDYVNTTDSLQAIRDKQTDIETDTQDLQTQVGTDGAGLTNIPWNASWDTEVQSEVQDALEANHLDHLLAVDYDPASKPGTATALLNELVESDSGVSRFTSNALEQGPGGGSSDPLLLQNTTIATLSTQTSFTLTAGSGDDDAYNGALIVVTDQSTSTQKAIGLISDYTGSTRTVTLASDPGIFTMATGDTVDVIAVPKQLPDAEHAATGGLPTVDTNNYIAGVQGTKNTLDDLNDVSTAQVNSEVDTALSDIHLDHLLAADYDPSSKPGTATALFNELVENDGGVSRFTANALEQAPDTDHTGTGSGLSAIPWNAAWDTEVQSEVDDALVAQGLDHLVGAAVVGADVTDNSIVARLVSSSATADWDDFVNTTDSLQAIRDKQTDIETDTQDIQTQVGTAGDGLTGVPWNAAWDAEVQSEVQDALEANHLDHLLAVDYDPNSKPGTSTALLNELVENDGGVSRFTTNALEQGPGGGGSTEVTLTSGTIGATGNTTTTVHLTGLSYADDDLNGYLIIFTDESASLTYSRWITDWVNSTAVATLDTALPATPEDSTDTYTILGIRRDVDVTQISGDATAADNAEAFFDGTGYAGTNNVIPTVTDVTNQVTADVTAISGDSTAADNLESYTDGTTPMPVNTTQIEGTDATDQLATSIDTGLQTYGLDHLLGAAVTGTDVTDNSIIARMVSASATADWDDFDNTTDSLQAIRDKQTDIETDTQDLQTQVGTAGAGLTNVPWNASWDTEVQSEVQDAIEANHLDHLLAADYDPSSKPGTSTALLNELVENDGGVSRFTSNALEQAPSAGTNPNVLVDTTIASTTSQTEFTLTAGSDDDDAYNDQAIVVYDADNSDYPSVRTVSDYVGSTRTITIDSAPDFTIANGDGIKIFVTAPGSVAPTAGAIADAVWDETQSSHTTSGSFGEVATEVASILADTNELQTDWADGGRLDAILDARASQSSVDTVDSNVDAILVDTGTTIPAQITGLNDISTAQVNAEVDTALADIGLDHLVSASVAGSDIADDSIVAQLVSSSATADWDDYDNTTDSLQANQSEHDSTQTSISGLNDPTAAAIRTEIDSNSTQLAAIVADTNELQTDDVPGLIAALNDPTAAAIADAVLDEALSGHTTAGTMGKAVADIETDATAILADTNELQTDWADAGRLDAILDARASQTSVDTVDSNVDAILVDTATTIPALIAALNDLSAADINAQVLDVMNTDTFAEPSGVPAATATLVDKIGYLHMALRNQVTVTASKKTFFDDGGSAEWEKDLSDDGTTYTETEANAI